MGLINHVRHQPSSSGAESGPTRRASLIAMPRLDLSCGLVSRPTHQPACPREANSVYHSRVVTIQSRSGRNQAMSSAEMPFGKSPGSYFAS